MKRKGIILYIVVKELIAEDEAITVNVHEKRRVGLGWLGFNAALLPGWR